MKVQDTTTVCIELTEIEANDLRDLLLSIPMQEVAQLKLIGFRHKLADSIGVPLGFVPTHPDVCKEREGIPNE